MKNKSVINTPLNSAVLLPTSGNRARNTLSQLAANHVSLPSAQLQHRLWSGMTVTFVTIAATRSSCQQSVPVPATSAHYPLVPRCDPEVSTSVRHKHYETMVNELCDILNKFNSEWEYIPKSQCRAESESCLNIDHFRNRLEQMSTLRPQGL